MKPRRILHLISKYKGETPLLDNFLERLEASRFQSIVCFLQGGPEGGDHLEDKGIETLYLDRASESRRRGVRPHILLSLKQTVEEKGIDLIHCHRHKPVVYGALVSLLAGAQPVVCTVHGAGRTRSAKRRFSNRFLLRRVERIIAVSEGVRQDILSANPWLPEWKVAAVPNGIDYTRILTASTLPKNEVRRRMLKGDEGKFWFGTVGRLTAVKNHKRLISAFAQVVQQMPDSVLLIAGDGALEEELRQKIRHQDLKAHVHLLGFRKDVPDFLHALDAFVLPSLSEGLPIALLEAMSAGLPLVVSDIPAAREVMNDVACGVYVNPEEEKEIASAMLSLRKRSPENLSQMGQLGRQRVVEAFSVDRMTCEIAEIYEEIMARRLSVHGSGMGLEANK
jgi:glycosyltransferase involved in cell wall biosynthesis